jgi:hypothetical protein
LASAAGSFFSDLYLAAGLSTASIALSTLRRPFEVDLGQFTLAEQAHAVLPPRQASGPSARMIKQVLGIELAGIDHLLIAPRFTSA